jgi:hypothetical protein
MSPKHLLWIAFGVAASAWYLLDPAAHPIGDVQAQPRIERGAPPASAHRV